jgi:uncharacterized protein involved in exopolysaccharide biosynthesis
MSQPTPSTDALEIVRHLDADAIKQRLDDLDRERDALRVLYRAALRARRDDAGRQEVANA